MTIGLWCNSQSQTRKTMLLSVASPKILVHAPERRLFHYWNECKTAIEAWWMLSICHTPSGISIRNSTKEGASMGMVKAKDNILWTLRRVMSNAETIRRNYAGSSKSSICAPPNSTNEYGNLKTQIPTYGRWRVSPFSSSQSWTSPDPRDFVLCNEQPLAIRIIDSCIS